MQIIIPFNAFISRKRKRSKVSICLLIFIYFGAPADYYEGYAVNLLIMTPVKTMGRWGKRQRIMTKLVLIFFRTSFQREISSTDSSFERKITSFFFTSYFCLNYSTLLSAVRSLMFSVVTCNDKQQYNWMILSGFMDV